MRGRRLAALLGVLSFAAALEAGAAERQDPFTVELALGYFGTFRTESFQYLSDAAFGARVLALGPYADGFQGAAGLSVTSSGRTTGLLGVRLLSGFEDWQTRLDAQLAVDATPDLAVGARAALGGGWLFRPGWRLGADLGVFFLAGNLRFGVEAAAIVLYNW